MKPTTIVFIAFVAAPVFAHPVIVNGLTYTKNEYPVIERRKPPHIHIRPIHINGKKVLKGFETAFEVVGTAAAFLRRDLDERALFDKSYEISARRSLPRRSINNDLQVRDFDDELEVTARDFGDELEARDFDELEVRYFDDLEAREFDDDFLDARALDETLDELD
ncbi:hypothetical protein APHAL10511_003048 [Amanita phalloides]|nr:hypothetical protein APHAL10511_003048 [Amanita phalloides]